MGSNLKAKPKKWTMPKWMEAYRALLADYGLGVEDLMNDHDSTFFNNEYRAALCISMKNQVALLERLHAASHVR